MAARTEQAELANPAPRRFLPWASSGAGFNHGLKGLKHGLASSGEGFDYGLNGFNHELKGFDHGLDSSGG
jgi:hypothetical protein